MMPAWISWGAVVALFTVGTQFVLFLRWLHRHMRDEEINRRFVRDVATVHLPHIYSTLNRIATYHGVPIEEPPLVEFIDFTNGRGRKRHAR